MVNTIIIRGLEYRKLSYVLTSFKSTMKCGTQIITRGEVLDLVTKILLPYLGFTSSPDNGITGKLKISETRIRALNLTDAQKRSIL